MESDTAGSDRRHLEALCEMQRLQAIQLKRMADDVDRLNIAHHASATLEADQDREASRLRKRLETLQSDRQKWEKRIRKEHRREVSGLKKANRGRDRTLRGARKSTQGPGRLLKRAIRLVRSILSLGNRRDRESGRRGGAR